MLTNAKWNQTIRNASTSGPQNASLDSLIQHFTENILSHMNETDEAIGFLKETLQRTNVKTEIHTIVLDKVIVLIPL